VASDAHNTGRRPLKLKFAYDAVLEQFGKEKAEGLFIQNPQAAFEGAPLPYVPEIPRENEGRKKKRFFFF
jgi:tyrosine-protein phosphatase YwqE